MCKLNNKSCRRKTSDTGTALLLQAAAAKWLPWLGERQQCRNSCAWQQRRLPSPSWLWPAVSPSASERGGEKWVACPTACMHCPSTPPSAPRLVGGPHPPSHLLLLGRFLLLHGRRPLALGLLLGPLVRLLRHQHQHHPPPVGATSIHSRGNRPLLPSSPLPCPPIPCPTPWWPSRRRWWAAAPPGTPAPAPPWQPELTQRQGRAGRGAYSCEHCSRQQHGQLQSTRSKHGNTAQQALPRAPRPPRPPCPRCRAAGPAHPAGGG